jgi:hypothetical protein
MQIYKKYRGVSFVTPLFIPLPSVGEGLGEGKNKAKYLISLEKVPETLNGNENRNVY